MSESITVKELKEIIKDIPDNYKLYVPVWGNRSEPVDDVYVDDKKKRLNVSAEVA